VLRRVAEAGYLVVDVRMPLDMAVLSPNRALDVEPAFPDVTHWALLGHSMGGAMAGYFVHAHPDAVDGLVIWDSYPPDSSSLAGLHKPVWHIHRATREGAPPESFTTRRGLFPPDSHWVPIRGGIHMYFGAFTGGGYVEDWPPLISRETQHEQVVAATVDALRDIEAAESRHP
jgi:pimeloyl-ACP methyl ester carboxylesterase